MTTLPHPDFIHLRVHSAYSLAEGAIKIPALLSRCVKEKMPAVALTDNVNLFGAMEFATAACKAGVQPILGCQLRIKTLAPSSSSGPHPAKNGSEKQSEFHDTLILLAQNEQGYKNLLKLVSQSWHNGKETAFPYITLDTVAHHAEGIIALTGGHQGPLGRLLKAEKRDEATALLQQLQTLFPNRLYMEIERHGQQAQQALEEQFLALAYEHHIPLVATNEAFFLDEEMYEAHDALLCITEGAYVNELERRRVTPHHRFKSASEMAALFRDLPEALHNTLVIAQRCSFLLEERAPILPPYPTDKGEIVEIREQAYAGLEERLKDYVFTSAMDKTERDAIRTRYQQRLAYELDIIAKMGFSGYFLIVADFIQWAKRQEIPVGPGRGSGAGSLVAWSLTITDIDPIRFNLLFERFLNPERVSMPDFDVDFCQDRRDEVINYVRQKYGDDRVAHIITFGKLQARAVLRDVGRVLQMPYGQVDRICKMIPNNPTSPVTLGEALERDPELQRMVAEDPTVEKLINIGQKLEGLYRHASTHAAGVVIGDRSLDDLIPLYYDPRSTLPATQFNMKDVEKAGLVKFDFLGLKTLTVLAKTVELAKNQGISLNLSTLPLDDERTFQLLNNVETVGIFQLEGAGMADVLRRLKPTRFEELIALVALYRPGPMDDIPRYLACKHGEEQVHYLHPDLQEILEETFGVMVYQEQVMQIAQKLGGYSLGGADLLRRAMGKKIKHEMDAQRQRFVDGAIERGIDSVIASQIFDQMAKFAGYGFNKSHSAPYALIAYQTAYLKANHPVEFIAASMTYDMHNTDKLNGYRQELNRMTIPLLPPDVNASFADFAVEKINNGTSCVRYALAAIKNVGQAAMEHLVGERLKNGTFKNIRDFFERIEPRVINRRQLENLILAGAFDSLHPNRRQLYESIEVLLQHANSFQAERQSLQTSLFGSTLASSAAELPFRPTNEWFYLDKLQKEFEAIGFYLSAHPLDAYGESLKRLNCLQAHMINSYLIQRGSTDIRLAGVVLSKKERVGKNGQRYAFLQLSDPTGVFECALFSEQLARFRELVEPGKIVLLSANSRLDGDSIRLTILAVEDIDLAIAALQGCYQITLTSAEALTSLQSILEQTPRGRSQILLDLITSEHKITLRLPRTYAFTTQTRSAMQQIPGIKDICGQ